MYRSDPCHLIYSAKYHKYSSLNTESEIKPEYALNIPLNMHPQKGMCKIQDKMSDMSEIRWSKKFMILYNVNIIQAVNI